MPHAHSQPTSDAQANEAQRFATHAARMLSDSHCEDVLVLNLRGISPVTDYFVIATGTSDRQLYSVAHDLHDLARAEKQPIFPAKLENAGSWVVADFIDVVVHLFSHEMRAYYDLESLWADAAAIDWRATTKPGQFARIGTAPTQDEAI